MAHTTATMLTQVAAVLQQAEADLATLWTTRITDALAKANRTIKDILIGEREYTAAQVAAWDSLDDYVRELTIFFTFKEAPQQSGLTWEQIMEWDCRGELRKMAILTASVEVTTEAAVSGGALDDGIFPTALDDEDEYVEDGSETGDDDDA